MHDDVHKHFQMNEKQHCRIEENGDNECANNQTTMKLKFVTEPVFIIGYEEVVEAFTSMIQGIQNIAVASRFKSKKVFSLNTSRSSGTTRLCK